MKKYEISKGKSKLTQSSDNQATINLLKKVIKINQAFLSFSIIILIFIASIIVKSIIIYYKNHIKNGRIYEREQYFYKINFISNIIKLFITIISLFLSIIIYLFIDKLINIKHKTTSKLIILISVILIYYFIFFFVYYI